MKAKPNVLNHRLAQARPAIFQVDVGPLDRVFVRMIDMPGSSYAWSDPPLLTRVSLLVVGFLIAFSILLLLVSM